MLADAIRPIVNKEIVKCDSAEPKSIAELQNCGINAYPVKKRRVMNRLSSEKSSILFGLQWLMQYELIVDPSLQNLQNELSTYCWKTNQAGEQMMQPTDRNNHLIDAARYSYTDEMLGGLAGFTV